MGCPGVTEVYYLRVVVFVLNYRDLSKSLKSKKERERKRDRKGEATVEGCKMKKKRKKIT